ncbi:MAG TPA: sigma-70 family RNA polymerase sigma factor [Streptosporangiaceae bacterium]|nr:sigma-70 family RNA polymerase sigma factor [Streptosporangiaceae bacterium]
MGDRDIVAAIVAGDPAGLAAAYDQYAASLHAYCRTLLGEPADAADAVQDTFVVAAAKAGGLRDPDRLRPWLYAVARNECHRRLRGRARQADLDEAAEPADDYTDLSEQAERAELRGLVVAAIGGLNPGDREVIELNLRHDLDGADLAQALGVPANQGHALASRARGQFERSLGALLVARTGRQDCAELNRLLAAWDGELTPLLRKRVSRHIENCEVCGERKRRVLSPAMLLTALPLVPLPAALRHQVLRLVSDDSPAAVEYCVHVAARSRPFDASGFPVQLAPVAGVRGRRRSGRSGRSGGPGGAAGGAAHARPAPGRSVLASVGVAAGLFLLGGGSVAWLLVTGAAHSLDVTSPQVGSVPSSAAAAAPPASSAPGAPSPKPAGLPHGPAQSGPASSAAGSGPAAPPPGSAPASAPVSPSSPPASSRPPAWPPPASPPPASSPPPTAPPRPGVLAESPAVVVLAPDKGADGAAGAIAARRVTARRTAAGGRQAAAGGRQVAAGGQAAVAGTWSGTFTLTATGGPVSFAIRAPAPFTVRPARGTVFPGQPVTVTVSVAAGDGVPFLTTLAVRPGGLPVLVEFPPAKSPPSSPPPSQPPASSPPPSSDPPPPSDSPPPTQPE